MKLIKYISEKDLDLAVKKLAAQIDELIGESETFIVANLKGSFMFYSDLMKYIQSRNVKADFMSTESYIGSESSGNIKITRDLSLDVKGKCVVLVEDILDSGLTLHHLYNYIKEIHQPSRILTCVLLDKPAGHKTDIKADLKGFDIENQFVVGYGLDYYEKLRNIPYIAQVEFEPEDKQDN